MDVPDSWESLIDEEESDKPFKVVRDEPEGESREGKVEVEKGRDEPKLVSPKRRLLKKT